MTVAEIAAVVDGDLHGVTPAEAAGIVVDGPVVTDSREARAGSLYIARIGETTDGHRFVPAAHDAGAVASLTTRPVDGFVTVVVPDEQEAFVRLSREIVRRATDLTIIGITGSSGKTSTKDLLSTVLAAAGETVAPIGSYNSEVGVPLTVCRITEHTRFLVVEMGARGIGHIAYLTRIAPPHISAVLNVGSAHVGEFGSREAIATAKAEIVQVLGPDDVAVLNADDAVVRAMAGRTAGRVVLVGEAADACVRADRVRLDDGGRASFTLSLDGERRDVTLRLVGAHHVGNALTVAAIAHECGLPTDRIVAALEAAGPVSRWRMEVTERPDGVIVVNDAYNANPDSMHAAIEAVAAMASTGRRWAVLGTMLELGDESERGHAEVGAAVAAAGLDELLVVGDRARPIATGAVAGGLAPERVRHVADATAAEAVLGAELGAGDIVLFKSSRDAGLRWLGDRIAGREATT